MAKEVLARIRYNGKVKSFTADVSHEFALKHNLQVGSRFGLRHDDGHNPNETILRGMTVGRIKSINDDVDMESSDVQRLPCETLEIYTVEV